MPGDSFSFGCYFYVIVNYFTLLIILWLEIWLLHFGCVGYYREKSKILNWRVTLIVLISYAGTPNMLIWLQLHRVTKLFVCGTLVVSDHSVVQFFFLQLIILMGGKLLWPFIFWEICIALFGHICLIPWRINHI